MNFSATAASTLQRNGRSSLSALRKSIAWLVLGGSLGAVLMGSRAAWAQEVSEAAQVAPNKGDVAFMIMATMLVVLMTLPGLALFYGGLVRAKNMLSIFMQVFCVFCVSAVIWVVFGYSMALTDGGGLNLFIGGFEKVFLRGIETSSLAATFSDGVYIPEYLLVAFQLTFAGITPALIVGSLAERARFPAVLLFCALWMVFAYIPVAHMVWYGDGALIFDLGAIDFAGGLVVHMNAGLAGLIVAILLGPRIGFKRENFSPHSLTLTMIGASLLWVGWFGFNAGSNLEADGLAALALLNTITATAGATLAWILMERLGGKKPSALGAATGAIAGLVAITPAAGSAGPVGAILLGAASSAICYLFVTRVKERFGYDDSLDCFGVHGVGGIVGALGTAIVHASWLGGQGDETYRLGAQLSTQALSVIIVFIWCSVVTVALFFLTRGLFGFRPEADAEREGLDLTDHDERAYS